MATLKSWLQVKLDDFNCHFTSTCDKCKRRRPIYQSMDNGFLCEDCMKDALTKEYNESCISLRAMD